MLRQNRGVLPAFLTTVLFSISAVSATRIAHTWGGTTANFLRLTVAMVLLGVWAHTYGSGLGGAAFTLFLLSGCIGFGIGDIALYQALPRIGSRLSVMLVHCVAAPFAALTEWIWLGTKLSAAQIFWSAMILAGVSVALAPEKQIKTTRRLLVVGVLFGLLAAFGQGFGAVLSRKAFAIAELAGEQIDGLTAAYQRIIAGWVIAGIAAALVHRHWHSQRAKTSPSGMPANASLSANEKWRTSWQWLGLNALTGPTLGVGCYQWALATTPTGIVLPIVAITPLMVIPFVRWIEHENPTVRSLIGGVIAVAGAVALARLKS